MVAFIRGHAQTRASPLLVPGMAMLVLVNDPSVSAEAGSPL